MRFRILRRAMLPAGIVALTGAMFLGTAVVQAADVAATIEGFAFKPNPLTVLPGDKVTYENKDQAPHTVTSDTAGVFESGTIAAGAKGSITAPANPGTYTYFCKIHPGMKASLIVQGPSAYNVTAPIALPQIRLEGKNEVPAVTVNALGFFSGALTADGIEWDVSGDGADFTASHIHLAVAGANGPVVVTLYANADAPDSFHVVGKTKKSDLGPVAWESLLNALSNGGAYVNVHSKDNPGGALRGQIAAIKIPASGAVVPTAPKTGTGMQASESGFPLTAAGAILVAISGIATLTFVARKRS